MPTGLYFPTSIYCDELPLADAERERFRNFLYTEREKRNQPFRSMSEGSFTSYNSNDALHATTLFAPLFEKVVVHATRYAQEMGADVQAFRPGFLNSWGNIYPKGEYVRQHNHPNSVMSGVYYLDCPPGTGGTHFINPLEYARAMDYPAFAERNMKNFEEVYFDEQPGRIILFPGWLKHYTEANQSDQDRVILSFNLSMFPTAAPGAIVRPPHVTTR
jgi:uncharacterized protein (TIGR02466 family)